MFSMYMRYGMRPLITMLAGSAIGGMVLAILGIQANSYGLAVILSPLMYIYEPYQFISYIVVGIFTFVLTFIAAYLFAVPRELMVEDES